MSGAKTKNKAQHDIYANDRVQGDFQWTSPSHSFLPPPSLCSGLVHYYSTGNKKINRIKYLWITATSICKLFIGIWLLVNIYSLLVMFENSKYCSFEIVFTLLLQLNMESSKDITKKHNDLKHEHNFHTWTNLIFTYVFNIISMFLDKYFISETSYAAYCLFT